nr:ABC transporter permease subunit [Kineococcus siccus]
MRGSGRAAAGVGSAVPLLALVALAVGVAGPTASAVVLPVGLVCTVVLVRALAAGLAAVPPAVVEAARAAGSTRTHLVVAVELRTALPTALAGLRTAAAAAVTLTTAGAVVGHGGLGDVLVRGVRDGVRDGARAEVVAAAVLVVLLALLPDLLLLLVQRRCTPRGARVPA